MKPRSRFQIALALFGLVFGSWCWLGRASTVRPPEEPPDPVIVHLLSTGRHAGLLIPCGPSESGQIVEYGYGAWSWYALGKDDWWRAPATVLWPNSGTLARRYLRAEDLASAEQDHRWGEFSALLVSNEKLERLLTRLDVQFAAGGTPHHNDLYGMDFVRHPARFWFAHDCHDEVAVWLRELGCSVSSSPIRTKLSVREPER